MAFKNPLGPNFENSRVACKLLFFTKRSEEIYKPLKELSNFGFCSNLVDYRNVDEWPSKFSDFFVKSLWSSGRAYILHARGPRFECQPSQLFFLNLCVCNLKGYCLAFLMLSKSIQMKKCRLLKENNDDKMKKKNSDCIRTCEFGNWCSIPPSQITVITSLLVIGKPWYCHSFRFIRLPFVLKKLSLHSFWKKLLLLPCFCLPF